jgi:leucyl-tRNA synthetase
MDLRVSGKDLINNHLTFCLYTHTAVWAARPDLWPRGVRTNGHLLLNAEKMSKSTGNFKTLAQAIAEYGADAMRVALADAGDAMDDANFEHGVANGAILRLTRELEWATSVLPGGAAEATRGGDATFFDRVFANAIDTAIKAASAAYDRLKFREAVKAALYDLHAARDAYRVAAGDAGLRSDLVARYVDVSTRLLAPIAPHYADHVWRSVLGRPGTVLTAGVPEGGAPDPVLAAAAAALDAAVGSLRKAVAKAEAPPRAK